MIVANVVEDYIDKGDFIDNVLIRIAIYYHYIAVFQHFNDFTQAGACPDYLVLEALASPVWVTGTTAQSAAALN